MPKRGGHLTPEAREKCRVAHLGLKASPEARERMRIANRGRKHTLETLRKMRGRKHTPDELAKMRGRHHTPEAIEKIRVARLGKKASPETIDKMRRVATTQEAIERSRSTHLGRKHTTETKEKIRLSVSGPSHPMFGKHLSDETRMGISLAKLGKPGWKPTPKQIENRRLNLIGRTRPPDAVERTRLANTGKKRTLEQNERNRLAHRGLPGKKHSPEAIAKMVVAAYKRYENPEYCRKRMKGLHSKTQLEKRIDVLLQALYPNEFKYNGGCECDITIGGFTPDFVNVNGRKQLVEAFGSHWHPEVDEKIKQERYAKYGYSALIIWERELKDENALIQKIGAFVGKQPNHYFETCTGACSLPLIQ